MWTGTDRKLLNWGNWNPWNQGGGGSASAAASASAGGASASAGAGDQNLFGLVVERHGGTTAM
jgi:hypothetical protein